MKNIRRVIIAGIFLAAVPALAVSYGGLKKHPGKVAITEATGEPAPAMGVLSGVAPGTPVSYTLSSEEGDVFSGKEIADAHGAVTLPAHDAKARGKKFLNYNVYVERERDPLLINAKIYPAAGKMTLSGRGLEKFSGIAVEGEKTRTETRADWAGVFHDIEVPGVPRGKDQNVKVAFYSNNILGDARQEQSPLVLRVYSAPGGGQVEDEYINKYQEEHCNDDPEFSVCDDNRMDQQMKNIVNNYVTALMMATRQFSAVMMHQAMIFGTFLDAKYGLETTREFQKLTAEAHKDYHPSEQMCRFGTFMRSVERTGRKTAYDKQALSKSLMNVYLNTKNASTAEGIANDTDARVRQFRNVYCDPQDNNGGLNWICDRDQKLPNDDVGATDAVRMNKDIDFGRTVEFPLTLDIDYSDEEDTPDEQDVIALARNLYWPDMIEPGLAEQMSDKRDEYMDFRRLAAINNVAQNSFTSHVAMKARSEPEIEKSGWRFMKSLLLQFGLKEEEIDEMVGEYPSYYAQMEILTKKIYQDPDFYTHLYDKPANVARIGVAIDAIRLMQNRDFYEANLRREMLTSLMVESELEKSVNVINQDMGTVNAKARKISK
jgi:hypothetical protein